MVGQLGSFLLINANSGVESSCASRSRLSSAMGTAIAYDLPLSQGFITSLVFELLLL